MQGFTYLWLLFILAAGASGLALAGQRWSTAVQRDLEREQMFRGRQIALAIESFHAATPPGRPAWPSALAQLLKDERGPAPRYHLRQLYADPVTGEADWLLMVREDGSLRGVRSRSDRPALITAGLAAAKPGALVRLSDREFLAQARTIPAARSASAASTAAPVASSPTGSPADESDPPP
jgi:type II secretory pathway pseudopilin PulG